MNTLHAVVTWGGRGRRMSRSTTGSRACVARAVWFFRRTRSGQCRLKWAGRYFDCTRAQRLRANWMMNDAAGWLNRYGTARHVTVLQIDLPGCLFLFQSVQLGPFLTLSAYHVVPVHDDCDSDQQGQTGTGGCTEHSRADEHHRAGRWEFWRWKTLDGMSQRDTLAIGIAMSGILL